MRFIVLFILAAAGFIQTPDNKMEQRTLRTYLEQGAPFDFVLIDLRPAEEIIAAIGAARFRADCAQIATCEYPGCKPYNLAWPRTFKKLIARVPKDHTIILYCNSGELATKAATYLYKNGFAHVYNVGGFRTWTGPTVPTSEMKPISLLPEPSCKGHH